MKNQQAYHRIAQATMRAMKEQVETGKVNSLSIEAVYKAIEAAVAHEQSLLLQQLAKQTQALNEISQQTELSAAQKIARNAINGQFTA